jgi:hypothetical protein
VLSRVLIARVAQSVERSAVNRKVGGSNPPVSDIFYYNKQNTILSPRLIMSDYMIRSLFHGASTVGNECIKDGVKVLLINGIEFTFFSDLVQKGLMTGSQVG